MGNCDNHAEREGFLTVDLPSMNTKRYMCDECKTAFDALLAEYASNAPRPRWMFDPSLAQWERELMTGNPGETLGMEGREAAHAYMTRIAKEKPE